MRSGKTTVLGKLSASLDAFDPEAHRQVQVLLDELVLPKVVDPGKHPPVIGSLVVDHDINNDQLICPVDSSDPKFFSVC